MTRINPDKQLKILGNGVVPAQAEHALRLMAACSSWAPEGVAA